MFCNERKWRKFGKQVGSFCLVGVLAASSVGVLPVNAAAKPSVSVKKVVIPIGKQTKSSFTVKNKKSGAKYTYTTSNKKVVKVSSKGILTGVKNGTAKITVNQKLNKKVTKVGTVNVTVKKACAVKKSTPTYTYGREKVNVKLQDFVQYINPDATYQLQSSNTGIAGNVSLKKSKNYEGTIDLKKAGTVTFTIKETYKKNTTNICKFKITVKKATFDTNSFLAKFGTVDLDVEFEPLQFIKYATSDDKFTMESSNPDVMDVNGDSVVTYEEGEAILTIYNGEETLASVKIKVEYVKITGVNPSASQVDIFMGATAEECSSHFTIVPIPEGGQLSNCQVTVLDESVCSVNFDPGDSNVVEVIGENEGKTSIVISNKEGQTLKTIPVTVVDAMSTVITAVKPSTDALTVNMDGDESTFTFTTNPSYGYAENCTVEVEDDTICGATMEQDEVTPGKATVYVAGYAYGVTKLNILNQNEKVLATIPVKVVDEGYKEPKSIEVPSTTVTVYEGNTEEFIYTVKTAGAKADYCLVEVENPEVCSVQCYNDEATGNLEITAEGLGTTKIYIKSFEGTVLKTITVKVTEEPEPTEEPDDME